MVLSPGTVAFVNLSPAYPGSGDGHRGWRQKFVCRLARSRRAACPRILLRRAVLTVIPPPIRPVSAQNDPLAAKGAAQSRTHLHRRVASAGQLSADWRIAYAYDSFHPQPPPPAWCYTRC